MLEQVLHFDDNTKLQIAYGTGSETVSINDPRVSYDINTGIFTLSGGLDLESSTAAYTYQTFYISRGMYRSPVKLFGNIISRHDTIFNYRSGF